MTVTSWKGPGCGNRTRTSGSSTEWLLNTAHMYNVKDAGDSDVTLYYVDNLYGRNSHGNYVAAGESIADVRTAFDATYQAEYVTLPVYDDDDTSASTDDRDIPAASISRAVADNRDDGRTWLWYCEGEKTIRVLVDYELTQIVDLVDTGTTTTSTTAA